MPTFHCPSCGGATPLPESAALPGARVTCGGCGGLFTLPVVSLEATVVGSPSSVRPATQPGAPGNPVPPAGIPGYEFLHLLGEGGMGSVWKARQRSLNRMVAVKLLSPQLAAAPDFVKRFEREAQALACLAHPGITGVIDFQADGATGVCWFVMEYVDGQTLAQLIERAPPEPERALELFVGIAEAVAYSHERGIIHRDLKPGNVLVTGDGAVKVTDFGLAGVRGTSAADGALTKSNVVMGTVNYMAPEQRRDARSVDHRADVYSLGVILYELLTGELPLGAFRLPSQLRPGRVSPRLDEVVLRALATEPERRYQSVAEFLSDVKPLRGRVSMAPAASRSVTVVGPADGRRGTAIEAPPPPGAAAAATVVPGVSRQSAPPTALLRDSLPVAAGSAPVRPFPVGRWAAVAVVVAAGLLAGSALRPDGAPQPGTEGPPAIESAAASTPAAAAEATPASVAATADPTAAPALAPGPGRGDLAERPAGATTSAAVRVDDEDPVRRAQRELFERMMRRGADWGGSRAGPGGPATGLGGMNLGVGTADPTGSGWPNSFGPSSSSNTPDPSKPYPGRLPKPVPPPGGPVPPPGGRVPRR